METLLATARSSVAFSQYDGVGLPRKDATMKIANGIQRFLPTVACAVLVICILPPVAYFASVGPMFGTLGKGYGPGWSSKTIRRIYRPLFDVVPSSTTRYLKLCGVSELEAFFIMEASKGEPG